MAWTNIAPSPNPIQNAVNPTPPVDPNASAITKALAFLQTPGGSSVTNLAGNALSALGQYQQNQQQLQLSGTTNAANLTQNQYNADQANQLAKSEGVLAADPLGADQAYAQKNALANAILPGLRNAKSTPGDPSVASAMGTRTGGAAILPDGGLDPTMINSLFGPAATSAAVTQRAQEINSLDPNAAQPNQTQLFGAAGAPGQQQVAQWASQLQNASSAQRSAFDSKMQGYINTMVQQESDTGGFWHTFAKIAGVVGAAAATIMTAGGASPLLAGVIGAGAGAASSFGNGGNPLTGAIMGGGTAALGSALKGASPSNPVTDLRVNH